MTDPEHAFIAIALKRLRDSGDLRGAIEGAVARRLLAERDAQEPWLDKRGLAAHFACSVRTVEQWMTEGLPHSVIAGRAKFRVSEVMPWLDGSEKIVIGSTNGAAPLTAARPTTTEGVSFDGST